MSTRQAMAAPSSSLQHRHHPQHQALLLLGTVSTVDTIASSR